jgi:hypothetical protein
MSDEESTFGKVRHARFEIGTEDQLAPLRSKYPQEPTDDDGKHRLDADWQRLLADLHIRTGTLLKTDVVSFLLGAGASKECGGPLIGRVPLDLERHLLCDGIAGAARPRVSRWLQCFYLALRRVAESDDSVPINRTQILERRRSLGDGAAQPLAFSFEMLLSLLCQWRAALPAEGGRLRLDGDPEIDMLAEVIDECLHRATSSLAELCKLPSPAADSAGFEAYKDLLRKVLNRPLNLKRANIFTLNYDTLVEQAADAEGVVLIDGFIGSVRRTFRPESYDHDLYFPAETTEGRVHRLDRVLHLYKLHGSITWTAEEPRWENPYGIQMHTDEVQNDEPVLIYPTPAKWGASLGMPYSELMRRFAAAVVRPQSVLFVLGYGFGDEHICAIVRQALAVPSFTMVIVDPSPQSAFIDQLKRQSDRRVWVFSGRTLGTFTGFVQRALADLHDENIRRKVMETHRSLGRSTAEDAAGEDSNV